MKIKKPLTLENFKEAYSKNAYCFLKSPEQLFKFASDRVKDIIINYNGIIPKKYLDSKLKREILSKIKIPVRFNSNVAKEITRFKNLFNAALDEISEFAGFGLKLFDFNFRVIETENSQKFVVLEYFDRVLGLGILGYFSIISKPFSIVEYDSLESCFDFLLKLQRYYEKFVKALQSLIKLFKAKNDLLK